MNTSEDRLILETCLETSEAAIDIFISNDVLADIPIIGTAFKILKTAESLRNRAFAAKLAAFAQSLGDQSEKDKQTLKEKIRSNPEEAKRVGETLFLVLDRLTDIDKPTILGCIFLAYIDGVISGSDLRRMSQAIDASFTDDLKKLLSCDKIPPMSTDPWFKYLSTSGLTAPDSSGALSAGGTYYVETPIANMLRKAYTYGLKGRSK